MRELSLAFGRDADLVGTLCLPQRRSAQAPGVVMFNAGMLHRVGPHRVQVKLARALAARGVPSLRFDLHGMGDSARADGRMAHGAQVLEDLRGALDALQAHGGVEHCAAFGFCSGIVPSFRLAEADARVRALVLYDGFDLMSTASRVRYYFSRLRQHGLGRNGLAHYRRRARLFAHALLLRLRGGGSAGVDDQGDLPVPSLLEGLAALSARGVRVTLINAGSAYGVRDGQAQMRAALDRRGARAVQAIFLDEVDHLLTSLAAQRAFIDAVGDAFEAPPAPR